MPPPCKTCLVLPICKLEAKGYLNEGDGGLEIDIITSHMIFKCPILQSLGIKKDEIYQFYNDLISIFNLI